MTKKKSSEIWADENLFGNR